MCCHHSFVAKCNQNRPSTVVAPQATVLRPVRLVFVPQAVRFVLALPVALLGSEQVEPVRLERVEAVAIAAMMAVMTAVVTGSRKALFS